MLEITAAEMKTMDQYAIEEIGIPSIVLMESAALKVVEAINLKNTESYTIISATGNNGGDGLAIARRLILANKKVDLFILGDVRTATEDFQINLTILENMEVNYQIINHRESLVKVEEAIKKNDLTIDAIFGIGLDRMVEGIFYQTIEQMNQFTKEILAVDIPSGLDADSGEILGISVQANRTVSFHQMKKGLNKNKEYSGKTILADIGIPAFVTDKILAKKR
ncbi:MAG: NAD(P)H-hydrate epimerase [Atopostipes sp.]|nr:NAD(P)H-hydrate epimerase [Atopostipes sp.]